MCLYHSKTLLVKQGTFLHELWPDSAEKGDVLNTEKFGHKWNLILEISLLVNCLSPVKAKHWTFRIVEYSWMGGIGRRE